MRFKLAAGLIFVAAALAAPVTAQAQIGIGISITIAPPELPVYVQPPIPEPGYIWAPGYWAYGDDGYYWVPGTWVRPPTVGLLWTPGYWGWRDGVYLWNEGYWGPHVGFYGGVDYGFGYGGVGYLGGRWVGGVFSYNQTVNNFGGVHITNVYSETIVERNVTKVSFNGGTGGTTAQPTAIEREAAQEKHIAPTTLQTEHQKTASSNKSLLASVNHGKPTIAGTSKPNEFSGKGVVAAKEVGTTTSPTGNKPITGPAGTKLETKLPNTPEGSKPNAVLEKQQLEKQQFEKKGQGGPPGNPPAGNTGKPQGSAVLEKQGIEKQKEEHKGPSGPSGNPPGGNTGGKPLTTTNAGNKPPPPPPPQHPAGGQPQEKGKEKKPPG